MDFTRAFVTIKGTAPYSQSHKHDEPKLEGEQPDAYDLRTWRSKMNTQIIDGKPQMVIPAFGLHMAITNAAQYSQKKIEGQRNATWTAKLRSGIAMMGDAPLGIHPDDVKCVTLSVHADGKRGSGARVTRRFPQIPMGWEATFEVLILDPIITQPLFNEMVELAGLFKGIGQYRPENGGSNGRFVVKAMDWQDNRRSVKRAA